MTWAPMIARKYWYNETEWGITSWMLTFSSREAHWTWYAFFLFVFDGYIWNLIQYSVRIQMRINLLGHLQNTSCVMRRKLIVIVFLNWWILSAWIKSKWEWTVTKNTHHASWHERRNLLLWNVQSYTTLIYPEFLFSLSYLLLIF